MSAANISLTLHSLTAAQATAILALVNGNTGNKAEAATPAAKPASEPAPAAKAKATEKPAPVAEKPAPAVTAKPAPATTGKPKPTTADTPKASAKKAEPKAEPEPAPAPKGTPGRAKQVACSLDPITVGKKAKKAWTFKVAGIAKLNLGEHLSEDDGWRISDENNEVYIVANEVDSSEYNDRRAEVGAALEAAGCKKIEWNETDDADLAEVLTAPGSDDASDGE